MNTTKSTELKVTNVDWIERIAQHGVISSAETTPGDALGAIKTLRDALNNTTITNASWLGPVLEKLDEASDLLEFPSEGMKQHLSEVK